MSTDQAEAPAALPDTPAGRTLAFFLERYNRGDLPAVEAWIARHYADPQAYPGPDDDRMVWNAMDYSNALVAGLRFDPSCGLSQHRLERSRPDEIGLLARAGLAGEWVYLKVRVALEPPHHLIEFRARPALAPPDAQPSAPLSDEAIAADLAMFVERLAAADIFSGAVLVARDGHPFFSRVYGLASREFQVPNALDTKFNIGSLNKMFTATAIAQLAEQGRLSYQDTVASHLPDFPPELAGRITIHHLLTHLSGIGSYWNARFECERPRIRTVQDFMSLFVDEPLAFEPGQHWRYSNGGFIVLGAIIESITGQSYYDYVREQVYQPAGMVHTDAYEVDRPVPNLAVGYTHIDPEGRRELGPHRSNLFMHVVKGGPGGGGFSTVEDLLRFGQALNSGVLLGPHSVDALLRGKANVRGPEIRYGYGFFERHINGQRVVGHSGNFPGIGAQFDLFLDSGYTVAVLSNCDPCASQVITDRLRNLLTRGKQYR